MVNDAIALYKITPRFVRIFQKIEIRNPDRKQFLQGLQYQRITPYIIVTATTGATPSVSYDSITMMGMLLLLSFLVASAQAMPLQFNIAQRGQECLYEKLDDK
jgi:hypothetical protein